MEPVNETKMEKLRRLLSGTFILFAVSLNQAAAYIALLFWPKIDLTYFLIIVFVSTIVFSIYTKNIEKSIFYTVAASILGGVISLGILLIPVAIYEAHQMIDIVELYGFYMAKPFVCSITICMIAAILGSLLSDGF